MINKLLHFINVYSSKEFSYKSDYLIAYGEWYEISSSSRYTLFKEYYLELCKKWLLDISIRNYNTIDKELDKILKDYKAGFIKRIFRIERKWRFHFDPEEFEELYDKKPKYIELDIHIRPKNSFIDSLFYIVEDELGTWEENKDEVWEKLFSEINKTLEDKRTYSWELEVWYVFKDFIKWDDRYVYFLLKDLEYGGNLKIKNVIIKEGRIIFKLLSFTGVERKLFTSKEVRETINKKASYMKKWVLHIWDFEDKLIAWKPKQLIQLFYQLKKDGEYSVSFWEMMDYLDENNFKWYEKLKGLVFKQWVIKEILRKKNISYSNKDELKLILTWDFFRPSNASIEVAF